MTLSSFDEKYYVYTLSDSNGNVFYVGKGTGERMFHHEGLVRRGKVPHGNKKLYERINRILKSEDYVTYKVIFTTNNESEAYEKEGQLIRELRDTGITNKIIPSIRRDSGILNLIKSLNFISKK